MNTNSIHSKRNFLRCSYYELNSLFKHRLHLYYNRHICVIELMALKETARSLNHNLIIYKYE